MNASLSSLSSTSSKWSTIPVTIMSMICSSLTPHEMLLTIERTCRLWRNDSKRGIIGWNTFNLDLADH
jgi:hypothetical protein